MVEILGVEHAYLIDDQDPQLAPLLHLLAACRPHAPKVGGVNGHANPCQAVQRLAVNVDRCAASCCSHRNAAFTVPLYQVLDYGPKREALADTCTAGQEKVMTGECNV